MLGRKPIILGDDAFGAENLNCINRTGAATVAGAVYALDQTKADAGSTTAGKAMRGLLPMTTARLGFLAVIALAAVADDAEVECVLAGATTARVNGTVAFGDPLIGVNGQDYLVTGANGKWHAIALGTNTSGTAVIPVLKVEVPQPFSAADVTSATLTGTEEMTNKTLTAQVVKNGVTASGSAANNFGSSTGAFTTSSGANTLSGDTTVAAGKRLMVSVTATPVAAAGSTQADAAALSASDIVAISSDSAAKGVKLIATAAGNRKTLINTSGTAALLYPVSGGTLNGLSADAAVVIAASKCYELVTTAANTWTVIEAAKATAA
jgi:hypothetical protein